MTDARTPTTYFRSQEDAQQAFDALHSRLDQLVARVQSLKEERARTKAHKEILVDSKKVELEEAEAVEQVHKVNLVETLQALTLDLKTKVVLVDLVLKLL